jgi:hypothetical protein
LAVDINPKRAMFMSDSGGNCLALHIAGPNLVWGVGYDLLGVQNPLQMTASASSEVRRP